MEVAKYIDRIRERKNSFWDILPYLITAVFLIAGKTFWALLDCGIMLLCFLIRKRFSVFPLAVWVSCVILFCSGWAINKGSNHIIPKEDLEKVWIKFYKVDKARTREYGGSGIGLSIVKAIMDSMHQKCGVKNYENGVEFWFELSCADAEE